MKLITGRAGTGKTYKCLNEIKRYVDEAYDKPLIYIVPEQFSFEAEKELINTIGRNGIIGTEVLSFKRLAYRIFEEEGIVNEYIGDAGKSMLVYYIMVSLNNKLKILKNVNKNPGLVCVAIDMIDEFKRYKITPDAIKSIDFKNEYLNMKMSDLYIIYDTFENIIKNEYIDINDNLTILANVLKDNTSLKGAKVWIDEFDGFTVQELDVIKELNRLTNLTVTITTDNKNNQLFILNDKNIEKLKKMKVDENIHLDISYRFSNKEIQHLEENIFKFPYDKYEKEVENILINLSSNLYSEIEDIAMIISNHVRDNNIRYENIAVLTNDLDSYKNIISKVFKLYEIPFFLMIEEIYI